MFMIFFNVNVLAFLLHVFKQISWIAMWGMIFFFTWLHRGYRVEFWCSLCTVYSHTRWELRWVTRVLFLWLCDVFRALINPLVCSFHLNQFRLQYYYYYVFGWGLSRNRLPGGPLFLNTRMIVKSIHTKKNLSYSPLKLFTDFILI